MLAQRICLQADQEDSFRVWGSVSMVRINNRNSIIVMAMLGVDWNKKTQEYSTNISTTLG